MLNKLKHIIPKYAILPLGFALLFNTCVYEGVSFFRGSLHYSSIETSWDLALPFVPPFVLFYILAFAQWALNYILIARDSKKLCYRFVIGNVISKVFCLAFFVLMPTTMTRPVVNGSDLFSRLVHLIYASDPPVNLFPSIHCLESWCCIRASFLLKHKSIPYRIATVIMSLGVFASTLLIKQHVLVDVFGGIIVFEIGLFLSGLILRHRILSTQ